jgi:short-subunit dehydrogenase
VTLVSPGVVRTDFGLNALQGGMDSRQLPVSQGAEEVADAIVWAIRTGKLDGYTGSGRGSGSSTTSPVSGRTGPHDRALINSRGA